MYISSYSQRSLAATSYHKLHLVRQQQQIQVVERLWHEGKKTGHTLHPLHQQVQAANLRGLLLVTLCWQAWKLGGLLYALGC
jgi:hypothetical protein